MKHFSRFMILSSIILSFLVTVYSQVELEKPDGSTVTIDTFNPGGGWGNSSLLSIGSRILVFAFGGLLVAWIFIIIFAAIKIIREPGEGLEGGSKRIQNVLYGITIGLLFFVAVSFIGTLAGVGNIFEWSESFQECSCENAGEAECYTYRFQAEASREDGDVIEWYCYKEGVDSPGSPGMGWQTNEPVPQDEQTE
ncbi:hypothetical protein GF389_03510 [Candidatus Dojkabacteria bacterium]|nr:hypothetical protein [Candidatus Dojkabacteria bacterium]